MQFVPTRIHGAQDHLLAALLLCSPWLLDAEPASAHTLTLVAAGLLLATTSLLTNYECGLLRRIPVPVHSAADLLLGLGLVSAPWLLGFHADGWAAHALCGSALLLGALTVQPRAFGTEHPAFIAARLGAAHGGH